MDKQLLEQEAKEYMHDTMKGFVGDFGFSPTYLQYAYIAGATSSSTVKNLEREVERLKTQIVGLKVSNEELQHYKDTTLGLWATDKPEAIEDPLGILFQLTENNL